MKKNNAVLILLFFLLFSVSGFGQRKKGVKVIPRVNNNYGHTPKAYTVDIGEIKVWYAFCATDIKDIETYDDFQILEIGDKISKYYSWFTSNSDSLVKDWVKKNPNAQTAPRSMGPRGKTSLWSEFSYSEYYKDNQEKTFTEYTKMPHFVLFDSYYVESLPQMEWTIHDETKTVAGYTCQKATCHFRGRDFIAWFTVDIPYNNGPWKFGGLPGLILKVSDSENLFEFECVKIETMNKFPITKHEGYKNYKKTDRKKHFKLLIELSENWHRVTGQTPVGNSVLPPPAEYDALELE